MRHVLGFSINYVLRRMAPTAKTGELDSCLEAVTAILLEDLL